MGKSEFTVNTKTGKISKVVSICVSDVEAMNEQTNRLSADNKRLREEFERITAMATHAGQVCGQCLETYGHATNMISIAQNALDPDPNPPCKA